MFQNHGRFIRYMEKDFFEEEKKPDFVGSSNFLE
jgi:hypothetical protein